MYEMTRSTYMPRMGDFQVGIRDMPDNFHNEIPHHREFGKSVDPEKVLEKAAGILNCDLDYIRHS